MVRLASSKYPPEAIELAIRRYWSPPAVAP
jgi:hypothetical protein